MLDDDVDLGGKNVLVEVEMPIVAVGRKSCGREHVGRNKNAINTLTNVEISTLELQAAALFCTCSSPCRRGLRGLKKQNTDVVPDNAFSPDRCSERN